MSIKYLVILPLLFSKKEGASELDFNLNSYLLIIDTGVVGITKETLKHIADNYDKYEKYIAELGEITDSVIEPLKNKNIVLSDNICTKLTTYYKSLG